jgi:hypothetical protein
VGRLRPRIWALRRSRVVHIAPTANGSFSALNLSPVPIGGSLPRDAVIAIAIANTQRFLPARPPGSYYSLHPTAYPSHDTEKLHLFYQLFVFSPSPNSPTCPDIGILQTIHQTIDRIYGAGTGCSILLGVPKLSIFYLRIMSLTKLIIHRFWSISTKRATVGRRQCSAVNLSLLRLVSLIESSPRQTRSRAHTVSFMTFRHDE